VAIVSSVLVALVNVIVLTAGWGLLSLVFVTTIVRVLTYLVYAANAYRTYPALHLSPALFRRSRLREITGFSFYSSVIDWSYKLNYQLDQLVIGAFLGIAPVAVYLSMRLASSSSRDSSPSHQTKKLVEGGREPALPPLLFSMFELFVQASPPGVFGSTSAAAPRPGPSAGLFAPW